VGSLNDLPIVTSISADHFSGIPKTMRLLYELFESAREAAPRSILHHSSIPTVSHILTAFDLVPGNGALFTM
jgi:hypothetical protein